MTVYQNVILGAEKGVSGENKGCPVKMDVGGKQEVSCKKTCIRGE